MHMHNPSPFCWDVTSGFSHGSQGLPEMLSSASRQSVASHSDSVALQIWMVSCQWLAHKHAAAAGDTSFVQIGSDTHQTIVFFSFVTTVHKARVARNPNHKTTHTPSTVTVSWFHSIQTVWFRGSVNGRLQRLIRWGYLFRANSTPSSFVRKLLLKNKWSLCLSRA